MTPDQWARLTDEQRAAHAARYGAPPPGYVLANGYPAAPTRGAGSAAYPMAAPTPSNGMGTAGLVLGILALTFSVIPLVGVVSWFLWPLGVIFALIGLQRARSFAATNRGAALAGLITSLVAAGICLLWTIAFIGAAASGPKPPSRSATQASTGTVSTVAASAPGTASAAAPKPAGPATTFGDGMWVVGEDIVAGTYRSPGATPGLFDICSVSTYSTDTADGHVLDWQTANTGEPVRIKVSGSVKSVKSVGCEPFAKVT